MFFCFRKHSLGITFVVLCNCGILWCFVLCLEAWCGVSVCGVVVCGVCLKSKCAQFSHCDVLCEGEGL